MAKVNVRLCLRALTGAILLLSMQGAVAAGPTAGGMTSDNVEYLMHMPFEAGSATGARVVGDYLYVTSWKSLSIYDVSDPLEPARLSITPFGFGFENEDVEVTPDGEHLFFAESAPQSVLHVWNAEDKSNPIEVATLPGAGEHTANCVLSCRYLYGADSFAVDPRQSSSGVVDVRDPANPKLVGAWDEAEEIEGYAHDVFEARDGLAVTSKIQILDVSNPLKPRLLAQSADGRALHSISWPNGGRDRFILGSDETNADATCSETSGAFQTFDTRGWRRTHTIHHVEDFRAEKGTTLDGNATVNVLGCSSHWFQAHPKFRHGGLVAVGFYEHGTRFVEVAKDGLIEEVGYFLPFAGSTSAAYWLTDRIVYAVDYARGIDVLRYNGEIDP
ncbi:MAG TPA: hypothetical protein VNC78_08970 [Actinomycetota bacterium]|nr:hypothetical protein [Actinomycetota bacterium]